MPAAPHAGRADPHPEIGFDSNDVLRLRPFGRAVLAVGLLGLLLREWFALIAIPTSPLRGDVLQYVVYAYNMVEFSTFSRTPIGAEVLVPDTFRSPGYPAFLALAMLAGGVEGGWYALAVQMQVVVGAASCVIVCLFARPWLGSIGALAAGALLAVWPHHVVASATLLSEVLFGFLILLALWLSAAALRRRRAPSAAGAGAAFAAASLVNPVIFPFALAVGGIAAWLGRGQRWPWALLFLPVFCTAAWSARNAALEQPLDEPGRAAINLVQGSWPEFHQAYIDSRGADRAAAATMSSIDREANQLHREPIEGARTVLARMAEEPLRYLAWYVLEKPWLLWDWDIRIGVGGIYMLQFESSPFETDPALRVLLSVLRLLNPLAFALAAAAALALSLAGLRGRPTPAVEALLTATFFLWVTAIHVVFQAEPRYAIAYRAEQLLLVVAALAWTGRAWVDRRPRDPDA